MNILLAEDDKSLNSLLTSYLKKEGWQVCSTENGLDALKFFYEQKFDLILSDIMMPLCDGYTLARNVRENDKKVPILFMTARDDKPSFQLGYQAGIDDYITKPFDLDVLILKIKAILRRTAIENRNEVSIGNLTMDKEEHVAVIDGKEIGLSVREFEILFHLLSYPRKTFTRSFLMETFWDYDSSATSRTVDVYLSKIRDKTKNCDGFEIQTVHGLGYRVVLK